MRYVDFNPWCERLHQIPGENTDLHRTGRSKKREGLNVSGDRTLVTVRKDFGLRNGLKILIGPMTVI